MLDKIIQQQLDSLEVAKVTRYIPEMNRYYFKQIKPNVLEVGKWYVLQLPKSLLDPNVSRALSTNWNHGNVPMHEIMRATPTKKMGNMYLLHGDYLDEGYNSMAQWGEWEGWLPIDEVTILKEI